VSEAPLADAAADVVLTDPERVFEGLRGGRVIALLAVDLARDSIVMLRQFRLAAHLATGAGDLVEIVAGRVEKGEDTAETARREAMEEIGIAIGTPVPVLKFLSSPGFTDEFATLFVAAADSSDVPERAGAAIERESTRPFVCTIDTAIATLESGNVRNGYSVIGLQWLALNRSRLRELLNGARSD
jgi:ADP-ribose pyrophosphatase